MDNPGYRGASLDATEKKNDPTTKSSSFKTIPPSDCVRSTLAQGFATFVHSLSMVTMGLLLTTPTAIIGKVHKKSGGGLSLNKDEVSWYACLLPLSQAFGCFLSGFLQNYVGRRQGLLFTYIAAATTWIVLYRAESVNGLYISSILAGMSMGLNDAPSPAYVSEIGTPKLRGILVMYTMSNMTVGNIAAFLLAWLTNWKTSCLICLAWFLFSVTLLGFIPESPVWLIRHGRKREAIKALQWLRGWVSEDAVLLEFDELDRFVTNSNYSTVKNVDESSRKRKFGRTSNLFEGRTLRPFILIFWTWFFISHGSLTCVRSYAIPVLDGRILPFDSNLVACLFNTVSPMGGIWGTLLTRVVGRRVLALWVVVLSSIISVLMGAYILFQNELNLPWIYIGLYILLGFFGLYTNNIPWTLAAEIYPSNTKSKAMGITTIVMHVCFAIYVKLYYTLQRWMATQAIYISYGLLGIFGSVYLWFFMPEIEGKTKAEIGELFARDARSSCPHFREKK